MEIENMASSNIKLAAIQDLFGMEFFIPSYQRGYRWTERQVRELLDDLREFKEKERTKEEIYCLQPIVLRRDGTKWEIIDGQQRLTTIYIILSYINGSVFRQDEPTYELSFATRPNSESFLKNIDSTRRDENIDYSHICTALDTVKEWFSQFRSSNLEANELYPVLLRHTKVIWYEVEDTVDPIAIFTRINIGKIPLTNAELIKALLLSEDNYTRFDDSEKVKLKQLEIAGEWDRIEYRLQKPEFWYFLNGLVKDYDNRIEFLFNFIADDRNASISSTDKVVKDRNPFFSFMVFDRWIKQGKAETDGNKDQIIHAIWQEVKDYFLTFDEWYNDAELYHLIGYLICVGESIKTLKKYSKEKTKLDFLSFLKSKVRVHVNCQIKTLEYKNPFVKKVLLLFNIQTLLNNKSNTLFPFSKYKMESWDIEHIHSVESEMPTVKAHQTDWLTEVLKYTDDAALQTRIRTYLEEHNTIAFKDFETVYVDIVKKYSVASETDDIDVNDISNLALLDSGTNRGYKNAVFPIKRMKIIEKDKLGQFIPVCTKNVFLKYYTEPIDHISFWSRKDRDQYVAAIVKTLRDYLPNQN